MYKNISYYDSIKYSNLTDKAYDILEEMVVTLELNPGQTYSESEISSLVNIGRTPVREALKELEQTHMISIIPRTGILIEPVRLEECFLQMEVRSMLEKLVAVRAAKFSLPSERKQIADLSKRYRVATNDEDSLAAIRIDNEFNHLTANISRNPFAKSALMPMQSMARRLYFMQYHVNRELTKKINLSHISVMDAISHGDEQTALKSTEELITHVRMLSMSTIDSLITYDGFFKNK